MKTPKTIAITNQKGGVGKTTTALNLGEALTRAGKSILLVDADPQGSLTVSMGVKNPDALDITLSDLLCAAKNDNEIKEPSAYILRGEDMDFIPSNILLAGVETDLMQAMSRENILNNALANYKADGKYDYILIDCMPSLGLLSVNALAAANSVIIPVQPNFLSVKGLNQLLLSVNKVKRHINAKLDIEGILLTMVDYRTKNTRVMVSALRDTVKDRIRVFDTEIPRSVAAEECAVAGKTIFSHKGDSKVAVAYENLAREILNGEREHQFGIDRA